MLYKVTETLGSVAYLEEMDHWSCALEKYMRTWASGFPLTLLYRDALPHHKVRTMQPGDYGVISVLVAWYKQN